MYHCSKLFLLVILVLPACSSVYITRLNPEVPSPYIRAEKIGGKFSVDVQGVDNLELIHSASTRPPDLSLQNDERSFMLGAHAGLTAANLLQTPSGFLDRAEISLGFGFSSTTMVEMKVQILGTVSQEPVENDIVLTAFVRDYGSRRSRTSEVSSSLTGTNKWSSVTASEALSGGLSFGVFANPKTLIYGGFAYQDIRATVKLDQDANATLGLPAETYHYDFRGYARAASIGVRYGKKASLYGSASYVENEFYNRPLSRTAEFLAGIEVFTQ